MAKRYVVREESGCGCGSFFVFAIVASVLMTIAPYLLIAVLVIAVIAGIIYYPKYKSNKQRKKDEADLAERERQIELTKRRRDLDRQEQELNGPKGSDSSDDEWKDF